VLGTVRLLCANFYVTATSSRECANINTSCLCYTSEQMLGYVKAVQDVTANDIDLETFTRDEVKASLVRCPQQDASDAMVSV
jgi:hypothetical protein